MDDRVGLGVEVNYSLKDLLAPVPDDFKLQRAIQTINILAKTTTSDSLSDEDDFGLLLVDPCVDETYDSRMIQAFGDNDLIVNSFPLMPLEPSKGNNIPCYLATCVVVES